MQKSGMPPFWRLALGILMGTLAAVSAGSFLVALRHPATVVDPHYYAHGISYGSDGGEAPWRLDATMTNEALEIRVRDAADAPVAGGAVACRIADRKGSEIKIPFTEGSPGIYRTPRALLPGGDLSTVVSVTKGALHSTRKMVIFP